ncbi:lytic transglycosylase domain-containing protein [Pseudonocardia sp. GCM10023141]|uniref:lytic transglycosylase domain-containing protein n=1 Tax=Pseudonocardia sp. GCM10023141 TaxID=3252653 RepID=UPI0036160A25
MRRARFGAAVVGAAVLAAVCTIPQSSAAVAEQPWSSIPASSGRLPTGPPFAAVVAGSVLRAALTSDAPTPPAATAPAAPLTPEQVDRVRAAIPAGLHGIPGPVLDAYRHAADLLAVSAAGCHLDWSVLAGIGRIESGHAASGRVDAKGTTLGRILGPRLDGSLPGTAVITDSDGGAMDGDAAFDRATGPMQFLPGTWRAVGADGNGDGVADPNNVYDATLAAGRYLCQGGGDLRDPAALTAALYRYNQSAAYGADVVAWAEAYRTGATPVPARTDPVPAPAPVPAPVPAPSPPGGASVLAAAPPAAAPGTPPPATPSVATPPAAAAQPTGEPAPSPTPDAPAPSAVPTEPAVATSLPATASPATTPPPTTSPATTSPVATSSAATPTALPPPPLSSTALPPTPATPTPTPAPTAAPTTPPPVACPTAPVELAPAQVRVLPEGGGVLLRFTVPAGCTVTAATLRFVPGATDVGRAVQVSRVAGPWTDATTAVPVTAGAPVAVPAAPGERTVSVTGLLAAGGTGLLVHPAGPFAAPAGLTVTFAAG